MTQYYIVYFDNCCHAFFGSSSVNKGEMSVPLTRMSDLAPFAQVVVYTLMPSGEAVADSHDFPVQLCLNNKVVHYHIKTSKPLGNVVKDVCILES